MSELPPISTEEVIANLRETCRLEHEERVHLKEQLDAARVTLSGIANAGDLVHAADLRAAARRMLVGQASTPASEPKVVAREIEEARELLRRLRQWDMLVGYVGSDGEHHEATADAPYWRNEIDRVLGV